MGTYGLYFFDGSLLIAECRFELEPSAKNKLATHSIGIWI